MAFKKAVRKNVPVLIGIAGGTGSGKTYSALRMAIGLAGGKPIALIDTESGRALSYADSFDFQHDELTAPFTADRYTKKIAEAEAGNYGCIVIDSTSHVYSGEGGLLDQAEAELDRMSGSDWRKRDACKMASYVKPKMSHKRFVTRMLQVRTHIILCFRASAKVEMVKNSEGKTEIREKRGLLAYKGWIPECEKSLPYEMTAYFVMLAEQPGVGHPIKLIEAHKPFFPSGKQITEKSGELLAQWAAGGTASKASNRAQSGSESTNAAKTATTTPKPAQDAPESTPKASEECVDMMTVIKEVNTLEDLKRVGKQIKNMSDGAQDVLRPYYTTRLGQLKP